MKKLARHQAVKFKKPVIHFGLLILFLAGTFLLTSIPSSLSNKIRPRTLPIDLGPLNDIAFLDTHPAYSACGDGDWYSCACQNDDPGAAGWYCGGCPQQCSPPPTGCTVSYALTPTPPAQPNTRLTVTLPSISTSNNRCVALYQDGINTSSGYGCELNNRYPSGMVCYVNSGSVGSHTLQLRYGQSSLYPGVGCGDEINCNSYTYNVAASAPNITGLRVWNASPLTNAFTNTWNKTSGLQNPAGSNWINPMNIKLLTTPGTGTITNYYVAFYNKSAGSAYASIIDSSGNPVTNLKNLLTGESNYGNGFILRYDTSAAKYYVWDPTRNSSNGEWYDITSYTGNYSWPICGTTDGSQDCFTKTYYKVTKVDSTPTWKIILDKNFGSKSMYTAAYVTDNTPLSDIETDIVPVNGP